MSSVDKIVQRGHDRLGRSLHVGLYDHWIDLQILLGLKCGKHRVQAGGRLRGALGGRLLLAIGGDLAGARFVLYHRQGVARGRHAGQAQHLDRHGGTGLLHPLALVVDERADLARFRADHEDIADLQRAAIDQHGGDRAPSLVQLRLDHGTLGVAVGIGGKLHQFRLQRDLLDQLVEVGLLEGGDLHVLDVAAHVLDHDLVLQQALAHTLGLGPVLVDLVDRHDHRHAGRLRMADRLDRLGHQAVVGGHHQHDDVGDIGTAHPHFGERLVARRIEYSDVMAARVDLIGTNMLGDAAGLARHHVGPAQRIEQRGLAVVDMAHNRDHRRARLQRVLRIVLARHNIDVGVRNAPDAVTELLDQQLGGVRIDGLVDGDHHVHLEQGLHQVRALFGHAVGEFGHRDRLRHDHVARLSSRAASTAANGPTASPCRAHA